MVRSRGQPRWRTTALQLSLPAACVAAVCPQLLSMCTLWMTLRHPESALYACNWGLVEVNSVVMTLKRYPPVVRRTKDSAVLQFIFGARLVTGPIPTAPRLPAQPNGIRLTPPDGRREGLLVQLLAGEHHHILLSSAARLSTAAHLAPLPAGSLRSARSHQRAHCVRRRGSCSAAGALPRRSKWSGRGSGGCTLAAHTRTLPHPLTAASAFHGVLVVVCATPSADAGHGC